VESKALPKPKKVRNDKDRGWRFRWLFFILQVVLLTLLWLWKMTYGANIESIIVVYLLSTVIVLFALYLLDRRAATAALEVLSPV
jgi:fatty acid desaturase